MKYGEVSREGRRLTLNMLQWDVTGDPHWLFYALSLFFVIDNNSNLLTTLHVCFVLILEEKYRKKAKIFPKQELTYEVGGQVMAFDWSCDEGIRGERRGWSDQITIELAFHSQIGELLDGQHDLMH